MQRLRIFAASASDMTTERAKVGTVVAMLKPLADALGIVLDVVDWRSVVPDMGRPEQVILDQLKPTAWDVFVGVLWHRFGTPPGLPDPQAQKGYLSGTEEEFKTAYGLWKEHGRPRVMMYRCTRPILPDALDPDQFKRVKAFFAQFEAVGGEHPGLYQSFDTTESFERLLLDNLQRLLLEYGEQIKGAPIEPQVVQTLAPKIPNNLPRRASFFGRAREMEAVMRALGTEDRTWGVLVDGIGGIGKTSLAVEAAHRCKESGLFEAFVFVSAKQNALAPGGVREVTPAARTLEEFLNETARILDQTGILKLAGDAKRHALLDTLRGMPTLLVYDNLETLTKEGQEALAYFLRELPQGCKAVITSRRRGGEGSVWLRLEKLDWDAARQLIAAEAERDAGLAAKLRRAEARWQELYDATGGSPLALSHTLGLMRVRATLSFEAALEMLRGNRADADLQTFIFQEARRELTTNDEAALRALSFFAPSATFEAWMDVAQLSRTELETTIDRLSALSLIDILAGQERYTLHPLTRNFVRNELLSDAELTLDNGFRFALYWLAYAQRYGGRHTNAMTLNFIEAEFENLSEAAEWLWETADVQSEKVGNEKGARALSDLGTALCGGGPLFYMGLWGESLRLSTRGYEAARGIGDWYAAGRHAHWASWTYDSYGDLAETERWAGISVEAMERSGSKYGQALGLRVLGFVAKRRKDYDAAERLHHEGLAIWRSLKSGPNVSAALHDLGNLELVRGDYGAAERYFREELLHAEEVKLESGMLGGYLGLGSIALKQKNFAEARNWLEKALPLAREIRWQNFIAEVQRGFAAVQEAEGRPDLALASAQEALVIEEKLRSEHLPKTQRLVERLKKMMGEQ